MIHPTRQSLPTTSMIHAAMMARHIMESTPVPEHDVKKHTIYALNPTDTPGRLKWVVEFCYAYPEGFTTVKTHNGLHWIHQSAHRSISTILQSENPA